MNTPKAFNITSSADLLAKLEWEIDQAKSVPLTDLTLSGHHFWNCAVTAWHVLDWLFDERKRVSIDGKTFTDLASFQAHARSRSDALTQCYQFCNGGKHGPDFRRADPNFRTDITVTASTREMWPSSLHKVEHYGTRGRPIAMYERALADLRQIIADLR
jgi:hypothetical protein